MPTITMNATDPVDPEALARYQAEVAKMWAAQLGDIPIGAIAAYLREQGHGDVAHVLETRATGRHVDIMLLGSARRGLPLPFDMERDG